MSIKRALLLAGMALALVAFAAPSASAEWLHNHKAIEANTTIEAVGTAGFTLGESGTTCEVNAAVEAKAGTTTGTLLHFNIGTHSECVSEGSLAGCEIEKATVTNETSGEHITDDPAVVHIGANDDLIVTHITIDTTYTESPLCPATHNQIHIKEATLTPDNATTIKHFTVSGVGVLTLALKSMEGHPTAPVGNVTLDGTVAVSPEGTWGIEG